MSRAPWRPRPVAVLTEHDGAWFALWTDAPVVTLIGSDLDEARRVIAAILGSHARWSMVTVRTRSGPRIMIVPGPTATRTERMPA